MNQSRKIWIGYIAILIILALIDKEGSLFQICLTIGWIFPILINMIFKSNENSSEGKSGSMKKCKSCQTEIDDKAKKCPHCQSDQRDWFAKHPILTVFLVLFMISFFRVFSASGDNDKNTTTIEPTKTKVIPTSVPKVEPTSAPTVIKPAETNTPKTQESSVPAEYKSALAQASSYANTMYMSKRGVYDQLVSEYGGKFSAVAAQYAIDNVKSNWNANALEKAKNYQDKMNLSPNAIRDQLMSDYGEKFTQGEADYAIQNLND